MSKEVAESPVDLAHLAALAQQLAWAAPEVEVLRAEYEGHYPVVTTTLQDSIRASHQRGKLILPDLEAFGNETVAIFSDYGGETSGNYFTYSFLMCAWDGTGVFTEKMGELRSAMGLGNKEIAFKDFRMGQMRRALPEYLRYLDALVPGFLLTLVVDKRLVSLFGPNIKSSQAQLSQDLRAAGLGEWKPEVAEKLARVTHTCAFLVGLLAASGQKVFWMTDHDAICANEERHGYALELFSRLLAQYTDPSCRFPTIGGAAPFKQRSIQFLDLLSVTDIVAGSVEHYLNKKDAEAGEDFEVKAGSDKVLRWLAHDGIGLKKMSVIIRHGEKGAVVGSSLEFSLIDPPDDVTTVPVII